MKILVFTEGTIIMHLLGKDVSREERVKQSEKAGIQGEERRLAYESNSPLPEVPYGDVYDLENYVPVGNAVSKVQKWHEQGAEIHYLTSRRVKIEIDTITKVLNKYQFPETQNIHYRAQGQDYKDIAEELVPDVLIEDDCESIGGADEMTYTHINPEIKQKIKSIPVKEFGGIDHLPDNLQELVK